MSGDPIAVYVHVPFCPSKCGYCDFNSYAMTGEIVPRTTAAMLREIRSSPWAGRPARTVFFGGGTPTFLDAPDLLSLLHAVREVHPLLPGCEVTTEANPGTVDAAKFAALREGGFNRISMGAQSFEDADLLRLDRVHRGGDIGRAFRAARAAGFDDVNLDLMFALPGQSRVAWNRNLDRALDLGPEHLSLYCLTIETNTAFYKRLLRGELDDLPEDDAQVAMYDDCADRLTAAGYAQYEISNYARPGRECRHNLVYWRGEEYAQYGPGAVGRVGGARETNLKHPRLYSEAVESGRRPVLESEPLDEPTLAAERTMLGLRLTEGIPLAGLDPSEVARVTSRGWLATVGDRVALTRAGRHFHNEVAAALM